MLCQGVRFCLAEELSRWPRICGQAIQETKIGYLFGRKTRADGLPLRSNSEQNRDRSATWPIIHLKIFGRLHTQPSFFAHLASQGTSFLKANQLFGDHRNSS
jgi:hypothetical protein